MENEVSADANERLRAAVDLTKTALESDGGDDDGGDGSRATVTDDRKVGVTNGPLESVESVVDLTTGQDGCRSPLQPSDRDVEAMGVDDSDRSTPDRAATGLKQIDEENLEQSEDDEDEEEYPEEAEHPAAEWVLRRKRKREACHAPMTATQQTQTIAALKEKLQEFPAPLSTSPDKASQATRPTSPPGTADSLRPDVAVVPNKGKRGPKPSPKSPKAAKPKAPRKKKWKTKASDRKMPKLSDAQKKVIQLLVVFNAASTPKDVQEIVDLGGEILADNPDGEGSMDAEIKELFVQEGLWKQSATDPDECVKAGLKEIMKKFCERYGVIPMGAVEAAECAIWQIRREV